MTIDYDQISKLIISSGLPDDEPSRAAIQYRFPRSTIVGSPLFSLIDELTPKLISHPSLKYQNKKQDELKLVLTNLILSAFSFEQVSFPTKINKGSYYSNIGITRRGIESITNLLIEEQLCKRTRVGYKHPRNASKSRAAQYFPTPKLIKIGVEFLYEQIGDFDNYSPYKYKSEIHWDVNEKKNISILRNYNEFMHEHSWACKAPTVRILGEEPFTEGRVYTPYQNIVNRRVKVRENTFLDGMPLVECDFPANHPFMLGYLSGHAINRDFYDLISTVANVDRKMVKEVITKTIGANKKLSPQQIARNSKSSLNAEIVSHILNAIEAVHPWFKEFMFTNRGIYLQWLEGEIAMKMFEFGVAKEIPMINIHDAYAVSKSNEEITKDAMDKYRYEVLEEYKSRW
jgi:hypothetical protein